MKSNKILLKLFYWLLLQTRNNFIKHLVIFLGWAYDPFFAIVSIFCIFYYLLWDKSASWLVIIFLMLTVPVFHAFSIRLSFLFQAV